MQEFIMQMMPFFGKEEEEALTNYMKSGGFVTEFKQTEQFEKAIAEYTNAKHCVVVNNGTISLTLAALSLDINTGDEIIVPNYTMVATPNSVKLIGAKPVFVDVNIEDLCIDFNEVKKAITKKTKAIMLVSANGRYPKYIDDLIKFADEKGLSIIEDAAQSLGSYYPDGTHIGLKGEIGSFSFSAPKIISTGQGGALVTNNDEIARKLRLLKDFGRAGGGGNDTHESIGFNFKFTDVQAVIGLEQMKKLPTRVIRKKEIWSLYSQNLENIKEISLFDHNLEKTAPWFIDSVCDERDKLSLFLKDNNIGTRNMYPPINHQEAYGVAGEHPISNLIGEKGLWLPSAVQLTDDQINYITQKIAEFYGY